MRAPFFTHGSASEVEARKSLLNLFKTTPIPDSELLISLGLYTRSIVLAKTLYLNEIYSRILDVPGVVMEFGVWWGASMAMLASFRNVYEPYNVGRKIVGFDTWNGYQSFSPEDGQSKHLEYVKRDGYRVPENYVEHLSAVLNAHEADNVLAHVRKYETVKGDVMLTAEQYFRDHPETIVALASFDLALYEPTKKCLEAIRPHLVRGSVIAMDELNSADFPGETVAFRETFGLNTYRLVRSRFLPDRSYVVIE